MRATELWANLHGQENWGTESCHWCASPCLPLVPHDDLPPVPFIRSRSNARRPANPWVCFGCELFRRKRQTVRFLDGNAYKDGQTPSALSWFLSDEARAVRGEEDGIALYRNLLNPPKTFCLALLDGKADNHPHLWVVNEADVWEAGSEIRYTVNNVEFMFCPYELETALMTRKARTPGVEILLKRFGRYPILEKKEEEKEEKEKKGGAVSYKDGPKKVVG